MDAIRSRQNPRVRELRELADPRRRGGRKAFLVEGIKGVEAALEAGWPLREVWLAPALDRTEAGRRLRARLLAGAGPAAVEVSDPVLEAVADAATPQGVVAVAAEPAGGLPELLAAGPDLLLLADLQDPGNVGALWRTAAAAGFGGLVQGLGGADPYGPKVVRAAAGAAFRVPARRAPVDAALLRDLAGRGWRVLAAAARGELAYTAVDWRGPRLAVLVGNEGQGLGDELLEAAGATVRIPMAAGMESLNAAVSGSLLCFERARVRGGWDLPPEGGTIRGQQDESAP